MLRLTKIFWLVSVISGWATFCWAGELQVGSVSDWVQWQERQLDAKCEVNPAGLEYLFYDEQMRLESGESFCHYAYRIVSQEGLSDGAQIKLSFDPGYQSIVINKDIERL